MKIAFVGKGGSGKSTMSSLFIRYLHDIVKADVLAMDADLNMNLAGLLGVTVPTEKHLSSPDNSATLRSFLKGTNNLIRDENAFLPTTPPNIGSNLITDVAEPALAKYAVPVAEEPQLQLLTVGTYVAEEIGQACYHTNLFVAENLLLHTELPDNQWVVADMVAGTDAFSYSLHLQFDAIILIAEPTPESAEVCKLYLGLAKEAGIQSLIHIVANKIDDEDDLAFIEGVIGQKVLGAVPAMSSFRKFRQRGGAVSIDMLTPELCQLFETVQQVARNPSPDKIERFEKLRALHHKLCSQYWVISGYGEHVAHQYGEDVALKEAV